MRNLRLTRKSKCLRALLLYHNDNSSLYWLIFQSVTPLGPRTRYKQEPSFMHRLCLKMTCPQELFIVWRPVTFDTLIYLLISIFAFYGSIMGIIIYLLPCWFKNWVISQWWMAHSFRRSTWPAGHFSGACRCCSRKSAPDTALALQVVLSWPLWASRDDLQTAGQHCDLSCAELRYVRSWPQDLRQIRCRMPLISPLGKLWYHPFSVWIAAFLFLFLAQRMNSTVKLIQMN